MHLGQQSLAINSGCRGEAVGKSDERRCHWYQLTSDVSQVGLVDAAVGEAFWDMEIESAHAIRDLTAFERNLEFPAG